jgi:hypothetical protein
MANKHFSLGSSLSYSKRYITSLFLNLGEFSEGDLETTKHEPIIPAKNIIKDNIIKESPKKRMFKASNGSVMDHEEAIRVAKRIAVSNNHPEESFITNVLKKWEENYINSLNI